ncbi:MAG TPA: phosphate-starvation-inducible PsiE family protein [Stellaceae bacterium]|jgi:uncharacterized membrane protein (DUF373 family)|nr:phosphate-starvation-inducible PsiE family protein [Stellaceae bacterium]
MTEVTCDERFPIPSSIAQAIWFRLPLIEFYDSLATASRSRGVFERAAWSNAPNRAAAPGNLASLLWPGRDRGPRTPWTQWRAGAIGRDEPAWHCAAAVRREAGLRRNRIMLLDVFRKIWRPHKLYDQFEMIISAILLVIIGIIIIYSTTIMVITLIGDVNAGVDFSDQNALKDTFGLILTILILIEFNHSIALAMRRRSGVLEVRVVILISIIVIARKLILLDYAKTGLDTLLGLGGLALSLGALYWLLSDVERRRPPAVREE